LPKIGWKTKKVLSACVLTTSCLLLCSCDDFGDLAVSFVENDMPGISLAFVTADMKHRWQEAFINSLQAGDVQAKSMLVDVISHQLPPLDQLPQADAPTLLKAFNADDSLIATLNAEELQTSRVSSEVNATVDLCSDRSQFNEQGLGGIGLTGPLQSLVPKLSGEQGEILIETGFTVAIGGSGSGDGNDPDSENGTNETPVLEGLGRLAASIFDASQKAQQNTQLQKAVNEIPAYVVQPDKVFALSQQNCKDQYAATLMARTQVSAALSAVQTAIQQQRVAARSSQELIATYLRPIEIQTFVDADPSTLQITTTQQAFLQGALADEVHKRMLDVQALAVAASQPQLCTNRLARGEEFEDAVTELHAQIALFRGKTGDADSDASLEGDYTLLQNLMSQKQGFYKTLTSGGCQ